MGSGQDVFSRVPSYLDHGARGCTVKFIVRRVRFHVKCVKSVLESLVLHGWPWLYYLDPISDSRWTAPLSQHNREVKLRIVGTLAIGSTTNNTVLAVAATLSSGQFNQVVRVSLLLVHNHCT